MLNNGKCQSDNRRNRHILIEPAPERERSSTLGVTIYPAPSSSNDLTKLPPAKELVAPDNVESLWQRIIKLEEQLSTAIKSSVSSPALSTPAPSPATSMVSNTESKASLSGNFHIQKESRPFSQGAPRGCNLEILHKTRLLGPESLD